MEDSIVFEASISYFSEMMDWVQEKLQKYAPTHKKGKLIQLALEEAIVNVISHAYIETLGLIELRVYFDQENRYLEFIILDQGQPFNPLKAPCPDLKTKIEDRDIGGLGVHFLKKVTDHLTYERRENSNILCIRNTI